MKAFLYDWGGLNVWLFHAINNLRGSALDAFMQAGTTLGDHDRFPLYIALLAIAGFWWLSRGTLRLPAPTSEQMSGWFMVFASFSLAYFLDGFLVGWLKHALDFPRPPLALPPDSLHVVGKPELHYSLPSGHATFAMTVAASLWPLLGRPGRVALIAFVLWVDLSRISLGMHFPADVLAGNLVGLIVVIGVRALLVLVSRRPRS